LRTPSDVLASSVRYLPPLACPFFLTAPVRTALYTLSLHDALPIFCTRWRAISARRRRRISSSLLPENIGPTTTSIQPILPLTMSTGHSLKTSYRFSIISVRQRSSFFDVIIRYRPQIYPNEFDAPAAR